MSILMCFMCLCTTVAQLSTLVHHNKTIPPTPDKYQFRQFAENQSGLSLYIGLESTSWNPTLASRVHRWCITITAEPRVQYPVVVTGCHLFYWLVAKQGREGTFYLYHGGEWKLTLIPVFLFIVCLHLFFNRNRWQAQCTVGRRQHGLQWWGGRGKHLWEIGRAHQGSVMNAKFLFVGNQGTQHMLWPVSSWCSLVVIVVKIILPVQAGMQQHLWFRQALHQTKLLCSWVESQWWSMSLLVHE